MARISVHTSLSRLAAGALVGLLAACARYERIPDYQTPACRNRPIAPRPNALEFRAAASETAGGLSGLVRDRQSGQGVAGAVLLFVAKDSLRLTSDSVGAFHAGSQAVGQYRLQVRRIGYATVEASVALPLPAGQALIISLESMPHDGPCSGFAVLVRRKPWWKVW